MKRRAFLLALMAGACARGGERQHFPAMAAGSYRLDYSGVYGVGRVDLLLADGKVSGLNAQGPGPSYRGAYRGDGRMVQLDLVAHLPPSRQMIDGVVVINTAQDVPVRFEFPADLAVGARWPIEIATQVGLIKGEIARLP